MLEDVGPAPPSQQVPLLIPLLLTPTWLHALERLAPHQIKASEDGVRTVQSI